MAMPAAFKAKWFWYSVLCNLCWGGWILCSKLGSNEIPASAMQFIFTFGFLPVTIVVLAVKPGKFEKSFLGIFYGTAMGILAGLGGLALFAAYRSGGNTSVITAATALYPLITVVLAISILRERLTWVQVLGVGFAAAAIIIFSL
jgi:transporter family protein